MCSGNSKEKSVARRERKKWGMSHRWRQIQNQEADYEGLLGHGKCIDLHTEKG